MYELSAVEKVLSVLCNFGKLYIHCSVKLKIEDQKLTRSQTSRRNLLSLLHYKESLRSCSTQKGERETRNTVIHGIRDSATPSEHGGKTEELVSEDSSTDVREIELAVKFHKLSLQSTGKSCLHSPTDENLLVAKNYFWASPKS